MPTLELWTSFCVDVDSESSHLYTTDISLYESVPISCGFVKMLTIKFQLVTAVCIGFLFYHFMFSGIMLLDDDNNDSTLHTLFPDDNHNDSALHTLSPDHNHKDSTFNTLDQDANYKGLIMG